DMKLTPLREDFEAARRFRGTPVGQERGFPGSRLLTGLRVLLREGADGVHDRAREHLKAGRGRQVLVDDALGLALEGLARAVERQEEILVLERANRRRGDGRMDGLEEETEPLPRADPLQRLPRLLVLEVVRRLARHVVSRSLLEIDAVLRTGDLDEPLLAAADRADGGAQRRTGPLPL